MTQDELQAIRSRVETDYLGYTRYTQTKDELKLLDEIERLRGALEWYANEDNHWRSHHDDMCMSEVDDDGGYRARHALEGSAAA